MEEPSRQPVVYGKRDWRGAHLVAPAGRGEPFHRDQLVPVRLDSEDQARAHGVAIQQHGAGAAHAVLASDVRSGEAELVAQQVGEQEPRLDGTLVPHAVDRDADRHLLIHARAPTGGALTYPPAWRAASTAVTGVTLIPSRRLAARVVFGS